MFRPKLFTTLKNYSKSQFLADLQAGIIVGILAIPLAIAFAIASGVSPEKGLFTAFIAGFIISFLGGSRVQIGGPTGAFIVIVYGIIEKYGFDGLVIATFLAGILLIIMGLAKLGTVIQFIPYPVVVGFTSGIALIIFSTQVKDLFGLNLAKVPGDFLGKWSVYLENLHSINWYALAMGLATILILVYWKKISAKLPGAFIAIILMTVATILFKIPVETIGAKYQIPSSLPIPAFPVVNWEIIKNLFAPAMTIAILAGVESLLSAVVADGMIGGSHRSNTELIAQGFANMGSAIFGGIPATGAIARTAANIKNGGRTPIAGIVHALVVFSILLFLGKWAELIPIPCLAAILIVVAYNMSEWRSFKALFNTPKSDIIVLLVTFFLTVVIDLTVGIEVGIVLAILLFMRRMVQISEVTVLNDDILQEKHEEEKELENLVLPKGVEVYEVNGPFFFGAAEKFKEAMLQMGDRPKVRIIRMRHVPAIDSTGIRLFWQVIQDSSKHGTRLILSGMNPGVKNMLKKAGVLETIGEDNLCGDIKAALVQAEKLLKG